MIVVACHPEVVPDRFFDLDATREVTEVIGMTGISDRIQPERVIDLAGLRIISLKPGGSCAPRFRFASMVFM